MSDLEFEEENPAGDSSGKLCNDNQLNDDIQLVRTGTLELLHEIGR